MLYRLLNRIALRSHRTKPVPSGVSGDPPPGSTGIETRAGPAAALLKVDKGDWDKVEREIEQCQARVLQTLVPTILALGLIAFHSLRTSGSQEEMATSPPYLAMGATFTVLFASSLYVASLSYKIFQNAGFLSVFAPKDPTTIYWEDVVGRFRSLSRPVVIHSETTTAATILFTLAATYGFMFGSLNPVRESFVAVAFLTLAVLLLVLVAASIYRVHLQRGTSKEKWQQVYDETLRKIPEREE